MARVQPGRIRRLNLTVPFTFRRLEGGLEGGLQGGLQGGFKAASWGLQRGFKEASRGLQGEGGFKGVEGLEGGVKGA